jgi:hypothetical protein
MQMSHENFLMPSNCSIETLTRWGIEQRVCRHRHREDGNCQCSRDRAGQGSTQKFSGLTTEPAGCCRPRDSSQNSSWKQKTRDTHMLQVYMCAHAHVSTSIYSSHYFLALRMRPLWSSAARTRKVFHINKVDYS